MQMPDEIDCFDGGEATIAGAKVKINWCKDGYSWTYGTDVPHECFDIYDTDGEKYCRGIVFSISDVRLPAADVAPVNHGHWIFKKRTKLVSTGIAKVAEDGAAVIMRKHITVKVPYCSICGERGDNEGDATPFCPNCGARMDGDTDANGNDNKTPET